MFEAAKEDKELGLHKAWIAVGVLIVGVIGIVGFYFFNRSSAQHAAQTSAAVLADANGVRDLKVQKAAMQKDSFGTTAVWSVTLVNKSDKFIYTDIDYQTDYIAADNSLIFQNKGTLAVSVAPDGELTKEFRDAAYPPNVAWFKFKITGAKAKLP